MHLSISHRTTSKSILNCGLRGRYAVLAIWLVYFIFTLDFGALVERNSKNVWKWNISKTNWSRKLSTITVTLIHFLWISFQISTKSNRRDETHIKSCGADLSLKPKYRRMQWCNSLSLISFDDESLALSHKKCSNRTMALATSRHSLVPPKNTNGRYTNIDGAFLHISTPAARTAGCLH